MLVRKLLFEVSLTFSKLEDIISIPLCKFDLNFFQFVTVVFVISFDLFIVFFGKGLKNLVVFSFLLF